MILITGMYNVTPANSTPLVENIPGVVAGTAFTQAALSTVFGNLGPIFVSIAIFFFAFTCLMAYYYIAETTMVYLNKKTESSFLSIILKIVFLIVVYMGSIKSASLMWGLGDIGFGSMCYLNLIAIVLLTKPALLTLKDYDRQKAQGLDPIFDPEKAGIENADFWIEYSHKQSLK
jgi:AGCS family alanine or glycine:cation symporter